MSSPAALPARFVDVGDVVLHVRRDPPRGGPDATGRPTLVYLHSLGTDLRIWDDVVAALPTHRHLRLDLRGHGLSSCPEGPYTIRAMAHDVTSLLDELGVRDATLIGISVGGLIALRAGLDRPELFRALVVCDASARIGSVDGWNERIAAVHEQGLAGMRDLVLGRWFAPDFENAQPAAHRGYGEMLARCPDAGYVATCAALRDEDLRARLADLDLPVRVLCGALDASTPPDVARELASALPRGSFREIAGAGHLPCAERPLETAHEIGEFVQEIVHG